MAAKTPPGTAHASPPKTVKKDEGRSGYRLEYFRSAREELNLHFKQRENWLQRQLLSQVVLLALSQGIAIAGIQKANPYPDVLALSTPISLVLASLYYVEDSAISYLSAYIQSLTVTEPKLRAWDASEHVKDYVYLALPIRYLAHFTAFVVIPTGLFVWRIANFVVWDTLQVIEVVLNIVVLILIAIMIVLGFRLRREKFR
jgi:hypothetical protein